MVYEKLRLKLLSSQSQLSNCSFFCIKLVHLVPYLLLGKYLLAYLNFGLFFIDFDYL